MVHIAMVEQPNNNTLFPSPINVAAGAFTTVEESLLTVSMEDPFDGEHYEGKFDDDVSIDEKSFYHKKSFSQETDELKEKLVSRL